MRLVVLSLCAALASAYHPRPPTPRGGWLTLGWLDWLDGPAASEEARAAVEALCRPAGWEVRCEIGSEPARSVGGSGELSRASSATVVLDSRVRFSLDEGFDPPQGAVSLLRPSKLLQAEGGFWKVEADTDEGVPTYVQWRLGCAGGLAASGQQLVPAGPLYFNAKARASDGGDRLALVDGRITIKEDVGANTPLFAGRGILAEFKVVGTFEAREAQGGPEG